MISIRRGRVQTPPRATEGGKRGFLENFFFPKVDSEAPGKGKSDGHAVPGWASGEHITGYTR